MANVNNIHPGDKVQIKIGARDITNNVVATARSRYIEGSSEWGYVETVGEWYGKTKVRIYAMNAGKQVVVWQVEPGDVSDNIIHPEIPPKTEPVPKPAVVKPPVKIEASPEVRSASPVDGLFAPTENALSWKPPSNSNQYVSTIMEQNGSRSNQILLNANIVNTNIVDGFVPVKFTKVIIPTDNLGTKNVDVVNNMMKQANNTFVSDRNKLAEVLNDNPSVIQNDQLFPKRVTRANYATFMPASYDYSIETGNSSIGGNGVPTLDKNMVKVRAALGIPVHGDNTTAKYMKYFLYNRFKVPDLNLAHSRSFTHVFFTRPDINILEKNGNIITAAAQCLNHTESAMLWMRNPSLFKLLVDKSRCGDSNNFNMLLSNALTSFQIDDETISTNNVGKSWNEYSMQYGNMYTGRSSGEFTVNFTDDKYYSIIHLLKLWIIYIDNVARGAWSPSYNLTNSSFRSPTIENSHVYTKTLDYASSVYVFKVSEDGSDILYWTKYYGVFPVNTGANALSLDSINSSGESPKLNIRFKYSFKRDLSPISLLEFNRCSGITSSRAARYQSSFNTEYGHTSRPYVGTPFIEMKIPNAGPNLVPDSIDKTDRNTASLRLRFKDIPSITGFRDADLFGNKAK